MNNIKTAADRNLLLRISYTDKKGASTSRLVEPYEIKNGSLWAYCTERDSIRNFKLSNIGMTTVTNVPFTPRFPILI